MKALRRVASLGHSLPWPLLCGSVLPPLALFALSDLKGLY